MGTYGHVIVDECHHVSTFGFEQALKQVKAKYVLGLTATPVRKDGRHPIIMMQCGSLRKQIDPRHESLVSWRGTIRQYACRLHRSYEGKRLVEIYDYVDENVPVLMRMYGRRVRGYKSIGYVIQEGG